MKFCFTLFLHEKETKQTEKILFLISKLLSFWMMAANKQLFKTEKNYMRLRAETLRRGKVEKSPLSWKLVSHNILNRLMRSRYYSIKRGNERRKQDTMVTLANALTRIIWIRLIEDSRRSSRGTAQLYFERTKSLFNFAPRKTAVRKQRRWGECAFRFSVFLTVTEFEQTLRLFHKGNIAELHRLNTFVYRRLPHYFKFVKQA